VYLLNSTVTVEFILPPNVAPPAQSTLDVVILQPDKIRTYTDDISTLTNPTYTAPTVDTQGKATFDYIVNQIGRYRFTLSTGVEGSYTELAQIEIFVVNAKIFTADTLINKQVSVDIGTSPTFSSTLNWYYISCMALHPTDANKVVVGGQKTALSNYGTGVYDLSTDTWTEEYMTCYYNSVSDHLLLSSLAVSDTGRYVIIDNSQGIDGSPGLNTYSVYWTDDASVGWTLGSGYSTASHGQSFVTYDRLSGIWWWATGAAALYSSADGKVWNLETKSIVTLKDWFKGVVSEPNRFFLVGEVERVYYTDVAVNTGLPLGTGLQEGNLDKTMFSGTNASIMGITSDGTNLFALSNSFNRETATSATGVDGSWTERSSPTGLEGLNISNYRYIPGENLFAAFVSNGGVGNIYYSTNGYDGWVQSNTGILGTVNLAGEGAYNQASNWIEMPNRGLNKFAWVGYNTLNQYHVFYN